MGITNKLKKKSTSTYTEVGRQRYIAMNEKIKQAQWHVSFPDENSEYGYMIAENVGLTVLGCSEEPNNIENTKLYWLDNEQTMDENLYLKIKLYLYCIYCAEVEKSNKSSFNFDV
jgi:hypothetical protein